MNFSCDPISFPQFSFNKHRQKIKLEAHRGTTSFSSLCTIVPTQSENFSSAIAMFGSDFKRNFGTSEVKSTNVTNNPLIYTTGNASLLFFDIA